MLFGNRKQNRRSNRSKQSQRRNATTRRIQLLERHEDRRLMAVAGGFEEQLLALPRLGAGGFGTEQRFPVALCRPTRMSSRRRPPGSAPSRNCWHHWPEKGPLLSIHAGLPSVSWDS
jgi:hypothetical protein